MEMVTTNGFGTIGFSELNAQEMMLIDGGNVWAAIGTGCIAVGTVALTCLAAPAAVTALTAVGTSVLTAKAIVGVGIGLEVVIGTLETISAAVSE